MTTMNNNRYYDIFGVSGPQLEALCAEALAGGGDWCDLFFEDTFYGELLLRDSEVGSGGFHSDFGCGVRVLKGDKTGYAYSETTEPGALRDAARAAGAIALGCPGAAALKIAASPAAQCRAGRLNPMARDWREAEASAFLPWLEKLDRTIRAREQRVVKVLAILDSQVSDIMMYNSLGELRCETRPLSSVALSVVFQQGGRNETQSVSRSFRMGAEMLSDALLDELAGEALKGVDELFEAGKPRGGRMSVVMGAGASGILLHEAMGHAFEADFNRKGQSIFSEKMGRRICRKGINIIDDGTIPFNRGSLEFDDEGVPMQKTYMVEDGVLRSYLHDRISAAWYGVPPTGNGRRESFRYNPIPRMRATYMESGSDGSCADLIASVKKGVYVDQFANGEVKIGEGDFTFYVKKGFLIENGRLTQPVKDINIIGNGPEALADIRAVASDLKIDNGGWTCGKDQSVPVSCGIPSVLIGKLTVGGAQ